MSGNLYYVSSKEYLEKYAKMLYETKFILSLFLTLFIEIPILFLFIRYIYRLKINGFKIIFIGFIASFTTLPYLWFILPSYINVSCYVYIGEFLVFLFEAFIYNRLLNLNYKKAVLISFVANLMSFIIGFLIF